MLTRIYYKTNRGPWFDVELIFFPVKKLNEDKKGLTFTFERKLGLKLQSLTFFWFFLDQFTEKYLIQRK